MGCTYNNGHGNGPHSRHDDAFIFRQNQGISVCPISAPHRLPGGRCGAALRSQLVWSAAPQQSPTSHSLGEANSFKFFGNENRLSWIKRSFTISSLSGGLPI